MRGIFSGVMGATRRVTGGAAPLMLGYQKSGGSPTGHPAGAPSDPGFSTALVLAALPSSAVAGFGGQRFLVPQYEVAAKARRCAGKNTHCNTN